MRKKEHQDASVLVGGALFEKTYTGARQRLVGLKVNIVSGVQIEDIGFINGTPRDDKGWITVPQEQNYSFAFNTGNPIPTPLLQAALS